MEKKKLLLVAVSVGVFLVIVISASILIFTPNTGMYTAAVTPVQYGTPGASISPQERTPIISPPVVVDAEEIRESQPSPVVNVYNAEQPITINVPKPSTAAVPDTPARASGTTERTPATAPASAPAAPRPAATTAVRPPAAPASAAAQSTATTSSKSAAQPAASAGSRPATPRNAAHNDFWVQTGAFSTKIRAEGVKETLAEKGITSIIENRDTDGRTLYRVRVGPYTSENEANYWLALVKSIDGFADSQIRQTSSLR